MFSLLLKELIFLFLFTSLFYIFSLGADHDGEDAAKSCHSPGNYIMAPYIAEFDDETIYSINPWRFSTCSVNAFKSMMKYLNG